MTDVTTNNTGYKIVSLNLMESSFKRENILTLDPNKVKKSVDINVDVQIDNNFIHVTEVLHYIQKADDKEEVTAKLIMVGTFEKVGNPEIDAEKFGNVNGAAIIYPYLREHLTNLSVKSGVGTVVLPPFNFTAL